jgi:hypothetical protein
MSSKLDIINAALVSLGVEAVQDLNATSQSKSAAAFWSIALYSTLRAHNWNFAVNRATLAASITVPAFGYSTRYPLPSDWIRTISTDVDDYKQEGGAILCNETAISLRYVAKIDDPARFDALFVDALTLHLAAKLAYPLTQSTSQQDLCWSAYKEILKLARSVDAQEEPADEFEESRLISVRR